MKISLNWIKDYIDLDSSIPGEELADTITMSICEVEDYEETGRFLRDVVVVEVERIAPHPDADKLTLVTVNDGKASREVVCGASNFKVGDRVPFAGIGVELPGGFTIKKANIRGVESNGMLCAEDELGFSDDHSGLMLLGEGIEVGVSLDQLYPDQVDLVLEIDNKSITHRPDLWGHYGFARELGAVYRLPVKKVEVNLESLSGVGDRLIEVEVLAGELVPRFSGLSVDNVNVTSSPDWIRHRLNRVGQRPINNMVDLTNYVMMEFGQPMHAFDARQIAGNRLVVKLAEPGTKVMTLYQKEVTLDAEDMTICDADGALVVAGVVGGLRSGVTDVTESIFLEAANWDPVGIRKTSTKIALRTDACQRFEKSLDPEMSVQSIQRAVELLRLTNPECQIRGELIDIVNKKNRPISITTSVEFINRRLGKEIERAEILDIFSRLGFTVRDQGDSLLIDVPSYRRTKDVSLPEDLVEEIGRVHGFNNITPRVPVFPIMRPAFNEELKLDWEIKTILSHTGYHEAYNYPLTCQSIEDEFNLSSTGVMRLRNPVSENQNQMRTSLLPHFTRMISTNQKVTLGFKNFEIGRTYRKRDDGTIKENSRLMMGVSKVREEPGEAFYRLKADVTNLFSKVKVGSIRWNPIVRGERKEFQHSNIAARIMFKETVLGTVFTISPQFMDRLGLRGDVCVADLDLDCLFSVEKTDYRFHSAPKYPSVFFEVSLLVQERVHFREIRDVIVSVDKWVDRVTFLDVYFLDEFPGKKSMSISIEFRSPEKTLKSEEVASLQDNVVAALADSGYHLR